MVWQAAWGRGVHRSCGPWLPPTCPRLPACPRCPQCRMKDDIKTYLSSVGVDWEEVDDLAQVGGCVWGWW